MLLRGQRRKPTRHYGTFARFTSKNSPPKWTRAKLQIIASTPRSLLIWRDRPGHAVAASLCEAHYRTATTSPTERRLQFLWPQQWKKDSAPNRFCTGWQHGEPIDPAADPAGRWHAVF